MWRLTEDEYQKLQAQVSGDSAGRKPDTKPHTCSRSSAKAPPESRAKRESSASYRIVILAKRRRAIDPDNVFPKWEIDQLVEAGILPDDSSKVIEAVEKRVEIVKSKDEEGLTIEVWERTK